MTLNASTTRHGRGTTAKLVASDIRAAQRGTDVLFITAGMGGVTGTGAAPVIARIAKQMGVVTIGVVTLPFKFEGQNRLEKAGLGLKRLQANVDSLIVLPNDNLLEVLDEHVTQFEAFDYTNENIKDIIGGFVRITNQPHFMQNVDLEDVLSSMRKPGMTVMGTAKASRPVCIRSAVKVALSCVMQGRENLSEAKGMLGMISAREGNLKFSDVSLITTIIRAQTSPDANVIFGTSQDKSLKDEVQVTLVATGFNLAGETR